MSRSSNSPRYLAPASNAAISSEKHALALERVRHFVVDDALGEPLDNGGLAHTGLTDQDRVVLGPPLQDLDGAADLVIAADHRIELAIGRELGHVDGVFLERLALAFGIGRLDRCPAPNRIDRLFQRLAAQAGLTREPAGFTRMPALVLGQGQQEHLGGHVLVAALHRRLLGQVEHPAQIPADLHLATGTADLRDLPDRRIDRGFELGGANAGAFQQGTAGPVRLADHGSQQMQGLDVLVAVGQGQTLGVGQGLLELCCKLVDSHEEHPVLFGALVRDTRLRNRWGCSGPNQAGCRAGPPQSTFPIPPTMTHLFSPFRLRQLELTNRIIVGPMCQYSAREGVMQPWHTVHLGQLALGGPGMLIVEATAVEAIGRITPGCVGLYDDATEAGMADMLAVVRGLDPRRRQPIALQLGHAGRKASSHEPWNSGQQISIGDGGWQAVAPSAVPHLAHEQPPRALSLDDLDALRERFVDSTRRALRLGFDAIEMHAAHGYLFHQFLSPVANRRDDRYGGSLANRMRYPLEVLAAMRAVWPADKPLGVRISATDWDESSSWNVEEASEFCRQCEAAGADWIDVSSGGVSSAQKIVLGPGYQLPFARAVRRAVNIPVMAVGLITEPAQAEAILAGGDADLIVLARAFLYDPRWVWHAARELGETVSAPPQYWRSEPRESRGLFGENKAGQR